MDCYVLQVGSGQQHFIRKDNDEEAEAEAQKILALKEGFRESAILFYARSIKNFPAKPVKRELPPLESYNIFKKDAK